MANRVIDVSTFNGNVDYKAVKSAGITGVIIRAGFTGYGAAHNRFKDDKYEQNYKNAKAAGLNVGAYYYSCAMSEADAVTEANYFSSLLKGKQFELPVYMDVEETHAPSNMAGLGKSKLTAIVDKFCSTVENAGFFTGFYTGKYWANNYLDMAKLSKYTLWLAHWVARTDYNGKFDMWQFSESEKIPGISHAFDMSYCYEDFPAKIKSAGKNGYTAPAVQNPSAPAEQNYIVVVGGAMDKQHCEWVAERLRKSGEIAYIQRIGDVTADGQVTIEDARDILRKAIGLE